MIDLLDIKPEFEKRMAQTIETKTDGTVVIYPEKITDIFTGKVEKIPKEILYYKINEIILALNRLEDQINYDKTKYKE